MEKGTKKHVKSAVLFCNHSCEGSGSLPKIVNSWPFWGMPIWKISEPNGLPNWKQTNVWNHHLLYFLGDAYVNLCKWPFQKSCLQAPGDPPPQKKNSWFSYQTWSPNYTLEVDFEIPSPSEGILKNQWSEFHTNFNLLKGRQPLFGKKTPLIPIDYCTYKHIEEVIPRGL